MRTKLVARALAAGCIMGIAAGSASWAAGTEAAGRKVPPPEAFAACEGKKDGDRVTFIGARGETLAATCRMFDGKLAAAPDRNAAGKSQEGGRPPRTGEGGTKAD
jgi:hypothetical protein